VILNKQTEVFAERKKVILVKRTLDIAESNLVIFIKKELFLETEEWYLINRNLFIQRGTM
jgi:hypothetical protein